MDTLVRMDLGWDPEGIRPRSPRYRRCAKTNPTQTQIKQSRSGPQPYHTAPTFAILSWDLVSYVNPCKGVLDYEWDQRGLSVAQTPRDSVIDTTQRIDSLSTGTQHRSHYQQIDPLGISFPRKHTNCNDLS